MELGQRTLQRVERSICLFIDFYRSFILHFQLQTEVAGNAFAELDQRLVGDLEMFCHNFLTWWAI